MPANKSRVDHENAYYHIYNKGREEKTLFNDAQDFNTFIGYLNEYLTSPTSTPTKKVFTVSGKTFQGVPHLPKNYHKRLELVAYSLIPNSFSLIVKQIEKGSLESFIRSLSTRYSIYFNKKYQRSGQLFEGPCKSKHLKDDNEVKLLTYHLHKKSGHTSLDKYLYSELPEWVANRKDISTYREFIDKYEPTDLQKEVIKSLIFEKVVQSHPKPAQQIGLHAQRTTDNNQIHTKQIKIHHRVPEMIFASALFITLMSFGLINININKPQVAGLATENTEVEIVKTPSPLAIVKPTPNPEKIVTGTVAIKLTDLQTPIGIYSDIYRSREILKATEGVKLDLIKASTEWSEVKISDGVYGFVETKYTKLVEEVNTNDKEIGDNNL